MNFLERFDDEDKQLIFDFFAMFSRWEYALKRNRFTKKGRWGEAQADWDKFADSVASRLIGGRIEGCEAECDYLLNHPPRRQYPRNGDIVWDNNPRRENENDSKYLFRVIRDVRNNLFHGGKYSGGPELELARDRKLLESAIGVLKVALDLDSPIRGAFDEIP